ncbi:MAG: hypothetical protein M1834_005626 [Cirrosporium novae-zelandiae]|nr:MAG: hypothetical protein M1834_005626 [Cirrosporium novae-zelandiae]
MDPSSFVGAAQPIISSEQARNMLKYMHYAYPIVLLFTFMGAFMIYGVITARVDVDAKPPSIQTGPGGKPLPKHHRSSSAEQRWRESKDFSGARKLAFNWTIILVLATFVANAAIVICRSLLSRDADWWCGEPYVIYIVGSFFVYLLVLVSLIDTHPSPTWVHCVTWSLAAVMDIFIFSTTLTLYTQDHYEPKVGDLNGGELRRSITDWEVGQILADMLRLFFLFCLTGFFTFFTRGAKSEHHHSTASENGLPSETTRLHENSDDEGSCLNGRSYGTIEHDEAEHFEPGWVRPEGVPSKSWYEYLRGYTVFFPYLWPSKSPRLQLTVLLCFILLMSQRVVNVLVPYQIGVVTDTLSGVYGEQTGIPWGSILFYILYRALQGSSGLIGNARDMLWVPVSQYCYRELTAASFEHVHSLSLDFHLGKRTGEVLSALSKGNSINNFLSGITFEVFPMLIDLIVAFTYFLVVFDAYYALVVAIITLCYLYVTVRLAQRRSEAKRNQTKLAREEDAIKNDSLMSYETVKYFNAEGYEFSRYRGIVARFQQAEYETQCSLQLLNVAQSCCFTLGLLIVCFIAAYQVTRNQLRVGNFVTLLTYMAQLQQPLNYFGTFYRSIQNGMINAERLLELFKEQPTVIDEPDSSELPCCEGDIRFENVHFAYDDRKTALSDISFHCEPGTTTALVGESGGGKSTIFRLLFRFYAASSGRILVDNRDVDQITIDSLRSHIGVVPQDTVLFNETIMYNLKYARQSATDEEVYEACRAASIHDRIVGFPDGYNTPVGERGLRLSGGEKQRVAIARTILKNPRIILLDEATAALDTDTEQHIQSALTTLQQGRTMLVIAHRLSTITTANQILVLHNGHVAEHGTHEQLLAKKGRYASMWRKQSKAQKVADEAQTLRKQAEKLQRQAREGVSDSGSPSASQSEDERGGTLIPMTPTSGYKSK